MKRLDNFLCVIIVLLLFNCQAGQQHPGWDEAAKILKYYNITQTRMYNFSQSFNWGVAGALTAYDLPDLAACVAPRKLTFIGLQNAKKEPASDDLIADQMAFTKSVYTKSAPGSLRIISIPEKGISQMLADWLER